ncbi:MAG: hypothetical protein K2H01_09145 [Ruminococcus sp.]|nr:hypothetical protein [Ruminococcus sp.]
MKKLLALILMFGIMLFAVSCDGSGNSETVRGTVILTEVPITKIETSDTAEFEADEAEYIINTNTGKFHYTDCPSVDQMMEHNKWEYAGSRDELISQGYEPCKRCEP